MILIKEINKLTTELFKRTNLSTPNQLQVEYWKNNAKYNILLANTGSGKTLAFLINLEKILANQIENKTTLILCPSRELAIQIANSYSTIRTGKKITTCYGGHKFQFEVQQLAEKPEIIIGTPGRILDHFERNSFSNLNFTNLVIDEYDKTLELGFMNEIESILSYCNSTLKSIQLVSATEIEKLPKSFDHYHFYTHNFLNEIKPNFTFYDLKAEGNDKLTTLVKYLSNVNPKNALIFCTHREAAERIKLHLKEFGKKAYVYHGGLEQKDREHALYMFKSECVDTLVCTDLASRGLDIPELDTVFHYQFPNTKEDFTHRNGRTARMQKNGKVVLVHSENEPLPEYCSDLEIIHLKNFIEFKDFKKNKMKPYYLSVGRKDKIRKIDIVGFLTKDLKIENKNIGLIEVYDQHSLISVEYSQKQKIESVLPRVRIKKQTVKISPFR
jgi:ATP-dependent RNA helicase DeaD